MFLSSLSSTWKTWIRLLWNSNLERYLLSQIQITRAAALILLTPILGGRACLRSVAVNFAPDHFSRRLFTSNEQGFFGCLRRPADVLLGAFFGITLTLLQKLL